MRFRVTVCIALAAALWVGTISAQSTKSGEIPPAITPLLSSAPPQGSSAPLSLDDVERIALESNPEIAVARRRVALADAHVPVAGTLDDPMAMYRGWGVPLKKPWNYNAVPRQNSIRVGIGTYVTSRAGRAGIGGRCPSPKLHPGVNWHVR